MIKPKILLLTLITMLAATACAAGDQAETAIETTAEPTLQVTALSPATATMQTAAAEQNSATPEGSPTDMPPTQAPTPTDALVLPVLAPAPGWDNEEWINSDGPLPLEDLRGKVVLLEFWTFG